MRSVLIFSALPLLVACSVRRFDAEDRAALAGKTFVVTGASSGIGRSVALELGRNGANVVLAARSDDALREVATRIEADGGTAIVAPTDVAEAEQMRKLSKIARDRFQRVDVWINNAGVGAIGAFWDIPLPDQSRVIDVNLKGVMYGSFEALQHFKNQGYGTLVNVGSVDSEIPHAYHATYSATKAAVLSLGRSLNEELRLNSFDSIKVVTILPWGVRTPFWENAANYTGVRPTLPLMDEPAKITEAILHASLHPTEEVAVGWKAKSATISHLFAPDLTESVTADIAQKHEKERPEKAPISQGTLFKPSSSHRGTSIDR